jgi:hypothetical protein
MESIEHTPRPFDRVQTTRNPAPLTHPVANLTYTFLSLPDPTVVTDPIEAAPE